MEANNKYSSVLKLVNIPPEQPIAVGDKHQFEKNQPGQADAGFIDSQIINTRDQLIDKMEKKISLFDLTNFEFKLPPSKFPDVAPGTTNSISYQQKMYNQYEDTFANRLTSEQVDQIREKGEFNVYSKSQGSQIPYVWRINQCLLKGRVNRVNIWQDGLAWCYQFMNVAKDFFVQTIPDSCLNLAKMPLKFFDLIFGRKRLKSVYSPNYERQAYKDFWSDIMNNELSDLKFQIGHELLENMYVYYDPAIFLDIQKSIEKEERQKLKKIKDEKTSSYNKQIESVNNFKQALRSVENNFEQNWKKIRKNVLNKVSGEVEQYNQKSFMVQGDQQPLSTQIILKKDQTVVEKFLEQKYSLYLAHLKQHLPKTNVASQAVISSLLTLITIFNIIDTKRYAKQAKLSELAQKTRSQIRKNNSIRARSYRFVEKMFEEIYKPLKEQIDLETYDQIAVQLEKLPEFNEKYKSIMKKYWRFKKQFENIVAEKKKVLKNLYVADRVFDSYYILFPPYQVIKQGSYYSLKKTQTCQIDTSHHFWKCSLYAMRLKCWSLNCLKTFLGLSWAGPLGLRCLFGIDDFAYDQGISSSTGDKYDIKRTTFLGVFCTVLDGIKQSRNQFEGKPDLGILGKNCSRICNIIQCYVFRFIFVGVIGVLMCYPVAIILFSTICFLGVLTFWIWTPLVLILVYLFNILVFQFQISMYNAQCIIRAVPLISLVIRILFNVLKIVAAFLFLLIIAPLICLLYIIFLIIQRALRTFTDAVMACLLGCCGRTPSVDTCIATKISGPGMSRQHFYSIAEQDVYVLIQAALQKILMRKLNQLTREKLEVNKKKYEKLCSFVFKPFGYTRADIRNQKDLVQKNTSSVLNKFSKKFSNYMNRYPKNPNNIRFTQEEIETYFENSRKIVKNYVQKNQIQGWVFQEHQILNQDYEELTRKLWVQIFNCGESIFEPLQKIDERFKIQASGNHNAGIMKQNVAAITKAIKGQVDLSVQKIGFTPAKRSLLDKDYPLEYISKIFEHHSNNNSHYIFLNLSDPTCLFVPHRNLKELKQYDAYHLKIARQDRGAIIE